MDMHQIETIALANEVPWEGVGFPISNDLTSEQILKKAGLNWEVEKIPLYGDINGKQVQAEHYFLARSTDGAILDEVTESWQPCQNLEAFDIFKNFINKGNMEMEVAGSLKDGKIIWALAKVNRSITLFGGDQVDSYILFSNPHIFGQIINVRFSPIRKISTTTLTLPIRDEDISIARLTHRRKYDGESVKQMLEIAENQLQKYEEWALVVGSKEVSGIRMIEAFFKKIFPSAREKKRDIFHDDISIPAIKCMEIFETQPGSEFAPNSYWQVYNAVNFYLDHCAGRSVDNRLTSAWFGDARKIKIRAAELAYEIAKG